MGQGLDFATAAGAACAQLADSQGTVRLRKSTSNLFRARAPSEHHLDLSAFAGVFEVDPTKRTATVGGLTTYEDLVDATLPHGLVPLCVPQLRTITLGGAVTGLGIEAASFRNGCPHESVLGMDVLTGGGEVVHATAEGENADLFFGFPNSYGSLGYALRLEIELEPVAPFVRLSHVRFHDVVDLAAAMAQVTSERHFDGEAVDYMDATMFGRRRDVPDAGPLRRQRRAVGLHRTGHLLPVRTRTPHRRNDRSRLPVALGHRLVLVLVGVRRATARGAQAVARPLQAQRRVLEDHRRGPPMGILCAGSTRCAGGRRRRSWCRTWRCRSTHLPEFMDFFEREVGISPVWLCPLRQRDPARRWTLYEFDPATTYVNVGFWSRVELDRGADPQAGRVNRRIEAKVSDLGGRKSLYSTSFYSREQFYDIYGGGEYARLKARYDPQGRFPGLYEKTCMEGS